MCFLNHQHLPSAWFRQLSRWPSLGSLKGSVVGLEAIASRLVGGFLSIPRFGSVSRVPLFRRAPVVSRTVWNKAACRHSTFSFCQVLCQVSRQ